MSNIDRYQAVSCEMHSELELAIMHGKSLIVCYEESNHMGGKHTVYVKAHDLVTRGHSEKGEFLVAMNDSGEIIEIRLDKITHFTAE